MGRLASTPLVVAVYKHGSHQVVASGSPFCSGPHSERGSRILYIHTILLTTRYYAPPVGDGTRAVGTVGTVASTTSTGTLARVVDSMCSE